MTPERTHEELRRSLAGALVEAPSSIASSRVGLTAAAACITFVHMQRVGIRELHLKTGEWVRRAARGERVVVTERGRPVASLIPLREGVQGRSFRKRIVLPEFAALPPVPGDSTPDVSDDRDGG